MITQVFAVVFVTMLNIVSAAMEPASVTLTKAASDAITFPGDLNHSDFPDVSPTYDSMSNDPKIVELATILPQDAAPVSVEQLQTIRTGTWVSINEPRSTKIEFHGYVVDQPKKLQYLAEEFKQGAVPSDLQEFYGGSTCNHRTQGLWFEGGVLKTTNAGMTTLMGCSTQQDAQDAEALRYIDSGPKVYLDKAGLMYLVRPDGVASAWKRP